MSLLDDVRMDKTVMSVRKLSDPDPDIAYWHSKTPHERLAAMELMRQIAYGYDPATARIQPVLTVTRRESR